MEKQPQPRDPGLRDIVHLLKQSSTARYSGNSTDLLPFLRNIPFLRQLNIVGKVLQDLAEMVSYEFVPVNEIVRKDL